MSIPSELYRHIVSHVSEKRDLNTLLHTSYLLKREAECVLLESIDMAGTDSSVYYEYKRVQARGKLTRIFEHLRLNPSLILAVREVFYDHGAVSEEIIEAVMPLMANLSRLYIATFHSILNRCPFRLKYISFNAAIHSSLKGEVLQFLAGQPSVRELRLSEYLDIPSQSLPNLSCLICRSDFDGDLSRLLRGRPVTQFGGRLKLSSFFDQNSLMQLRVVSGGIEKDFDISLPRNLEYLYTHDVRTSSIDMNSPFSVLIRQQCENAADMIHLLPNLKQITLRGSLKYYIVSASPTIQLEPRPQQEIAEQVPKAAAMLDASDRLELFSFVRAFQLLSEAFLFHREGCSASVTVREQSQWMEAEMPRM